LKGGTAINLFVRDLPRLSVDIDLTFLPVADRTTSLEAIDAGLRRIVDTLQARMGSIRVHPVVRTELDVATKVLIQAPGAQVKIEVTPVTRGCVFEPTDLEVTASVEERFGYARSQVVSFEDLYGGSWSQHSTVNIRAISSTRGCSWRTRASTTA
jgi:hypothetical protein